MEVFFDWYRKGKFAYFIFFFEELRNQGISQGYYYRLAGIRIKRFDLGVGNFRTNGEGGIASGSVHGVVVQAKK